MKILDVKTLSNDWYQVYKVLTNFHYIERDKLLNYLNKKKSDLYKKGIGFNPICTDQEFRELIKENNGLIEKNPNIHNKVGIPQGTNISGLLANIYLFEFDKIIKELVEQKYSGCYRRYSDDIFVVVPGTNEAESVIEEIVSALSSCGGGLKLSNKKTVVYSFNKGKCHAIPVSIRQEACSEGAMQYLGFTYDGRNVRIRNATLGNFWKEAKPHIKNMVISGFQSQGKSPKGKIYGLYSHLKNKSNRNSFSGNFYSYIRKSRKIFEQEYDFKKECKIRKQVKNFWKILNNNLKKYEEKYEDMKYKM